MSHATDHPTATRRHAILAAAGFVLAGALAACGGSARKAATTARGSPASACVLTPEATPGPYYIPNHLTRRDITEKRPGLPLVLDLTVQDASTCKPIAGADVEIWHASAKGVYSDVQGNTRHFLRGHQKTNSHGLAIFRTIYPGWYMGRAPHIHLKVHVGGSVVHTGQLFFDDRTSSAVYATSAYRAHGQADTTNASDGIYAAAGGSKSRLDLAKRRTGGGYVGAIALGVRS